MTARALKNRYIDDLLRFIITRETAGEPYVSPMDVYHDVEKYLPGVSLKRFLRIFRRTVTGAAAYR